MLNNEVLFNNIKKLCEQKGIKITNLEKELGFGGGIISRWGNDADPSLSKIIQIADYFHISVDEIIGYKQDDVFLNMLQDLTNNKKIIWSKDYAKVAHIKKTFPFEAYDKEKYTENSYFTRYKEGYIIIYAFYENGKLINPDELSLYIQPSETQLEYAWQYYSTYDLKSLWIDILSNMYNVPVEIKAEQLKTSFMNEFRKNNNPNKATFKHAMDIL